MAALVTPAAASAALVSELMAQGRKSAAALDALLRVQDDADAGIQEVAAEILRCCDRALAALNGDAGRHKRKSGPHGGAATQAKPKRRTRASSGETTTRVETKRNWDDGFAWRKYGEKDIRGSDHPRHYFRCAYTQLDAGGCPARRQVQRSEEHDPPLYVITYFGDHTCHHGAEAIAAVLDDVKIRHSLVLDFGSTGGRSPQPDDGDAPSDKTSLSEELVPDVAEVESTPSSDLRAAGQVVELGSSADDVPCSSSPASAASAWDPSSAVCSDWDYFGNCSFDYVSEFLGLEDIAVYR